MRYPAGKTGKTLPELRYGHAHCGVGALVSLRGAASHGLVADALRMLRHLDHRGARGAEENTGDGAGLLLQVPHRFFADEVPGLPAAGSYGVAQCFLPRDASHRHAIQRLMEEAATDLGHRLLAWRRVPTDNRGLGRTALDSEPVVMQAFFAPETALASEALDVALYVLRCEIQNRVRDRGLCGEGAELFYLCSLDRRRIVYKGLLTCDQLGTYYPDLRDDRLESALVLVHSRFSTNTLGAWELAHPYRTLVHNGEFNTLRGNVNWMRAREARLASPRLGEAIERIKPVLAENEQSDSADFDHVLELLLAGGRSLPHALRLLIPEAWEKDAQMAPQRRAFYDYHATLMEPWDGPALVVATDGESVGAVIDRNGLRPCRYCVTRDDTLIMASESGTLDTPVGDIVTQGRLHPGQLLLADTREGRLVPEAEVFDRLTRAAPYGEWLARHRVALDDLAAVAPQPAIEPLDPATLTAHQCAFGYTLEGLRVLLGPMAESGKDPLGAMGNDAPLAVLSAQRKPLFAYFHQLFAQVTNPPLDYLREALVTSLSAHLGAQQNLLAETPEHCRRLRLDSPILDDREFVTLAALDRDGLVVHTLDATQPPGESLADGIDRLRDEAEAAVDAGSTLLVLDDRRVGPARAAMPSLLAVGAVHHGLIRAGKRTRASLVLASGEPYAVHHFCTLVGYGADAVYPWLAYRSLERLQADGALADVTDAGAACRAYRAALEDGLLKTMAKMGISTLESYKGAQVFECIGLDRELVDDCFAGTPAHLSGVGLATLEAEVVKAHAEAYGERIVGSLQLTQGGDFYWRRDGEWHQWNPRTIGYLQQAARHGDAESYRRFAELANAPAPSLQTLRGLLAFDVEGDVTASRSIPLDEVEPVEAILPRFGTGSMSFGALSREAHEAMAIAMNRIGGKAGSGEGGEQVERFGTEAENSMKQCASGRFGVTAHYLANARQIEIKMAQGAKPGEGGELPGGKVDAAIAEVRFTVPGVGLISPPPHHDIYSIEDLAQLIHDLKCANPDAEIHVKLVSKANVGTIAAGVAKARADAVLISGDAGGTGAAKKTSIKHTGTPWELGLAETHRVLMANDLRSRISLRVDGGMKTGRDVAIAALLGAEEFGFGTAPMVVVGCLLLRKCHCNTCSVGVATQDPELRARFDGAPEHIVTYLRFVAEELREIMATLGFATLREMIGRVDRLRQREVSHSRGIDIDVGELLAGVASSDTPYKVREQNHQLGDKLDRRLIAESAPAFERGEAVRLEAPVCNRDRSVGTLLSSALVKRYGAQLPPDDTLEVRLTGTAGQSFGAFVARGISLHLTGEANDYVGKGLSGGRLSVRTPPAAGFAAGDNVIVGNVALFGATGGEAYVNGLAGERFCVRNSGALAVVEGIGDHGCEYMTGGVALILGPCGKNFAAGMSGGEAYLLDDTGDLAERVNPERVALEAVSEPRDIALIRRLLENHLAYTGSARAAALLDDWPTAVARLVKVVPEAYAEVVDRELARGRDIRVGPPAPAREVA
ncbi:glutamate synthase large subunit [Billgrantia gudaonensis]|uniref:Glutamate synthase [NADPH] large chain n=1 Tax=Billgrantia gudaonensis TaxID=376427 RepID=A0A1G8V1D1_9GAMM|nr:glutamate synthase large subunit [Halomonas gudaonensis]SDJ59912.1 glutamate synthase (NADPH/NADH) large chain [Halomonas gudaonensis]